MCSLIWNIVYKRIFAAVLQRIKCGKWQNKAIIIPKQEEHKARSNHSLLLNQ